MRGQQCSRLFNPPTNRPLVFSTQTYIRSAMCILLQVCNVYKKCDHQVTLPDQEIKCDDVKCKFSDKHPANCPNCASTCWQFHKFPKQVSPHIDEYCPACVSAGRAG